ncbi:hypothetical protein BK708_37730 [Bacillus thuringiensis serovar yunnanensis]|nr:hypothetical protein BK708_37730 [Bacillus thuringiensis serovar yunnanensis]
MVNQYPEMETQLLFQHALAHDDSVAKIIKYKKSMTDSVRNPLLSSGTEEVIDELYLISDRLFGLTPVK